ncbi:hypothetical protein MINS_12080 [Mycolicibacterium insubricum]|uniref:Uncharacterized protein n=1 Tax=Mycolicibacterium insubricum TaxID=444597 RepID=A0A1X0CY98_9MYCO|nr:hypothetical protein [Mycolicibacterium insubricum]MCV7079989.1 hypothetical protein [Mycolicibacterium insubricum]ORA64882.1 hypothetical protein BST26_19435 [Mycolicibacterium insubricum]BBZ65779.1 hypothetical protein MINS_12080 [Mycolicibacterium insubricum]
MRTLTIPMRPRRLHRLAALILFGSLTAAGILTATTHHADASPGQCLRAGFCDSLPLTAVPTTVDARGWVPA